MASATLARSTRRPRRRGRVSTPPRTIDPILIVAALAGLLVSAYLAIIDAVGGSTLCLAGSDCDTVRASTYGHVAGLPVAALGAGYFLAVFLTALLAVRRASWQSSVLPVLGGIGLGAAITFVSLQGLVLQAWCPYCLVADAAALTIGLRALWPGLIGTSSDRRSLRAGSLGRVIVGAALGVAVLAGGYALNPLTLSGTSDASAATTASATTASAPAASSTSMSPDQLSALADHLRQSGAVFYGAYWCPHRQAQKQMFGAAAPQLPYVECDARGTDAQPGACQAAGVRAYPTWVIGGQKLEGEISPTELARLSGFGGQSGG
jgi:uncharacterized membrane protein/glutaredoxin